MSHQDSGPRNYVHRKFHEQTIEQKDERIRELEAALDWALRHGAYTDASETGFVYVSTDGHRKKLPPFPPLIPILEAARQRITTQDRKGEQP